MSTLNTSFVLAYHGCHKKIGMELLHGTTPRLSQKNYDWLGRGFYAWEGDPQRAMEWAEKYRSSDPFVIGLVVNLGNCLDLTNRENICIIQKAYYGLKQSLKTADEELPQNEDLESDENKGKLLRNLDCAVINYVHDSIKEDNSKEENKEKIEEYDTVRNMFNEGNEVYKGSSFFEETHIQIAIRNMRCIKGIFIPPEFYRKGC